MSHDADLDAPPDRAPNTGPPTDCPPEADSPPDRPPAAAGRPRHPGLALTAIVGCYLMIGVDSSIVNIALPSIGTNLGLSRTALSWVISAYLLTSGGLLLLGGRMGDIFGRRRMLLTGVALFTVASAAAGAAPSPGWLLAARAVQGVGGALSAPGTLALLATSFPAGRERNRALSIYSAAAGGGASFGLLIGGMLTDWGSWRWVFFVTVPIGLLVLLLARRVLPEPPRHPGRLDVTGAILSTGSTGGLVFGFIHAGTAGWRAPSTIGAFTLALLLLAGFVLLERRHPSPLLPLTLFADRVRAFALLNVALLPAAMLGTFYLLTQYFQDVLGYRPLQAGLAFLPLTLSMFAVVRLVPRLLTRIGPRPLMITGAALVALGLGRLCLLTPRSSYVGGALIPLVVIAVGIAFSFMPLNLTILSDVAPRDAGAASGLIQALQWTGSSLGLAVLATAFAHGSGAAGRDVGDTGAAATKDALVHGITAGFTVATGFALVVLLITILGIRPSKTEVVVNAVSAHRS